MAVGAPFRWARVLTRAQLSAADEITVVGSLGGILPQTSAMDGITVVGSLGGILPQISAMDGVAVPLTTVQVLTFGQVVVGEASKGAGNTLTFGQQIALELLINVGNDITFTGEPLANVLFGFADNTITFDGVVNLTHDVSVGNTITFGSIGADAAIKRTLNTPITFGQVTAIFKVFERTLNNDLTFVDLAFRKALGFSQENDIAFGQVLAPNVVLNITVSNQVFLSSTVKKCIEAVAANTITFTSEVARGEAPVTALVFGQTVVGAVASTADTLLVFDQILQPTIDVTVPLGNTLTFGNIAVAWIERTCDLHEYTPNRGAGSLLPATITLVSKSQVTLDCSGSPQLVLRNPNLSNVNGINPDRVAARSRGGTIGVFRDQQWPKDVRLSFTFSSIKVAERDALEVFLKFCLGKLVTYVDQECRTWEGIITNPDTAMSQDHTYQNSATIEMSASAV